MFPQARFVLFGFGDRRYLLHGANAVAALWPGEGIVLASGVGSKKLDGTFGQDNVITFPLDQARMNSLQQFVRESLSPGSGALAPVAPGPYADSEYLASPLRYSAARTCNTWAAQVLQEAGITVHSRGVIFAWQLWHQARAAAVGTAPGPAHVSPEIQD